MAVRKENDSAMIAPARTARGTHHQNPSMGCGSCQEERQEFEGRDNQVRDQRCYYSLRPAAGSHTASLDA